MAVIWSKELALCTRTVAIDHTPQSPTSLRTNMDDVRARASECASQSVGTPLTRAQNDFLICLIQRLDHTIPSHIALTEAWAKAYEDSRKES